MINQAYLGLQLIKRISVQVVIIKEIKIIKRKMWLFYLKTEIKIEKNLIFNLQNHLIQIFFQTLALGNTIGL